MSDVFKLTQYSHGSGCGCKISPQILEQIIGRNNDNEAFDKLLVGNATKDDAAVYQISETHAVISTADFFMPIVDDAFDFGAIASANALSDVYAMGGTPLMAIALLGWPVDKLPASEAQKVLNGARSICKKAGIPLAGGHSIDSPEPMFGLSVTGSVSLDFLKQNCTARPTDQLYLTKPLGVGIISAAQKRGMAEPDDHARAVEQMKALNTFGKTIAHLPSVTAMTDVTGFGLLGHLIEVCEGSGVSAMVDYASIPLIESLKHYLGQFIYPDMTMRNFNTYSSKVSQLNGEQLFTLCDPQTSGGLLICIRADSEHELLRLARSENQPLWKIGELIARQEKVVMVN